MAVRSASNGADGGKSDCPTADDLELLVSHLRFSERALSGPYAVTVRTSLRVCSAHLGLHSETLLWCVWASLCSVPVVLVPRVRLRACVVCLERLTACHCFAPALEQCTADAAPPFACSVGCSPRATACCVLSSSATSSSLVTAFLLGPIHQEHGQLEGRETNSRICLASTTSTLHSQRAFGGHRRVAVLPPPAFSIPWSLPFSR